MLNVPHHRDNRHLTESHLLTSSLNVHKLAVEGHWMYWHGIHTDVDDGFPNISFFLIVSGCYTTGGPFTRLRSASPANIPW